jgi:hypothetical protein
VCGTSGSLQYFLLPYIEQENLYRQSNGRSLNVIGTVVKNFICPADSTFWPTGPYLNNRSYASCSYACNVWVFDPNGTGNLLNAMPDGTSNVIIFTERYLNCNRADGPAWAFTIAYTGPGEDVPGFGCASAGWGNIGCPDYNQGGTPFQIKPAPLDCIPSTIQGAHTGSIQVGMGDGSVRGVTANVSERTWEWACYPHDGNPLPPDWNQ